MCCVKYWKIICCILIQFWRTVLRTFLGRQFWTFHTNAFLLHYFPSYFTHGDIIINWSFSDFTTNNPKRIRNSCRSNLWSAFITILWNIEFKITVSCFTILRFATTSQKHPINVHAIQSLPKNPILIRF